MPDDRSLPLPPSISVVTNVITADGQRLPASIELLSISVEKEVNRIPAATLVFRDGDAASENFDLSSQDLFVPGAEVEIKLGYGSSEEPVFSGIVVKHALRLTRSGESTLTVECRDKAVKMTLERRCKYFTDISDSDVAHELVGGHSLAGDFAATGVVHEELVQFDATDWDFLISRLDANGHICLIEDDSIKGMPPDTNQQPVFAVTFGATMFEFDAEIDARNQATSVIGVSWNPATQDVVEGEAEDPGVPENGNISSEDLADSLGGGSRLQHSGKLSTDEVQAWVNGSLLRKRLAKVRGRTSFQGLASVRPGHFIELRGVGERFNGPVFVSAVRHRVARGSWVTDVQFGLCPQPFVEALKLSKPPASSLLPAVHGLQIGLVTQLSNDPAGEHRVQVRLPVVDIEAEGIWARLSSLDAGAERGTFFLPEIDDEVLLGFLNDDPRDPVILGMLHSSAKPPPFQAEDENHEKGFVSRDGLIVRFHDEEKSITIATPEGNQIRLSEDETSVQIDDQNGNRVLLNADGITISAEGDLNISATGDVNITGSNTMIEADQTFAASGSSGSELTSDGTTTVKGSTVMIN